MNDGAVFFYKKFKPYFLIRTFARIREGTIIKLPAKHKNVTRGIRDDTKITLWKV